MKEKLNIILRLTPENRFTIPVLLHALESNGLFKHCNIYTMDHFNDIKTFISNNKKTILCYSFMTSSLKQVYEEVQLLNSLHWDCILVAGGPHATGNPDETLKMGFDIVFSGDGEKSFPEFILQLIDNHASTERGIINAETISIENSFPISNYHFMIPPLEITRGCFYKCTFCQTGSFDHIQHRSLASIENYLDLLNARNTTHRASFICPSGFEYGSEKPGKPDPDILKSLFDMVQRKGFTHFEYGIFPSELRVNTIETDLLKLIKGYCTNQKITIGAQSGSDSLLKKIRRGHTIEQVEASIEMVSSAGFRPQIDIIMGLPDETEEDQNLTLNWMKKIHRQFNTRIQIHYFLPLSGTPLEHETPVPLNSKTKKTLRKYYQDGIATNWWETGEKISKEIIQTKELIYKSESS